MAEGHQGERKPTWGEMHKLRRAIENNDVTTLEKVFKENSIDINADIDPRAGGLERTALHYAALLNKRHVVNKLVQLGADIHVTDYDGDTPLDKAVEDNKIDIVHFFIKNCNQDISKLKQENQQKLKDMEEVKKYLEDKG